MCTVALAQASISPYILPGLARSVNSFRSAKYLHPEKSRTRGLGGVTWGSRRLRHQICTPAVVLPLAPAPVKPILPLAPASRARSHEALLFPIVSFVTFGIGTEDGIAQRPGKH